MSLLYNDGTAGKVPDELDESKSDVPESNRRLVKDLYRKVLSRTTSDLALNVDIPLACVSCVLPWGDIPGV